MTVSVKRNLCMFLAVVMVCVFLPLSGSAQAVSSSQEEQAEAVAKQGVYEVVALRDENVKHFALPDGTYQAVLYGEAIHELDTNGQWQEIDNNIQLSNIRGTEVYSDASGRTSFAKKLSLDKPVFSIANGGYGISMAVAQNTLSTQTMALEGAMPEARVTNSAARRSTTWTSVEEAVVFDRSSTVSYADALPGVDLKYTVRNRNVEEHIVIKSKSNDYSYQFELDLEGLSACQEVDGSISLLDCRTNQRKYVIPTGLMYDANETVSYDVEYVLTEVDGKYCLSIDPDAEWINDPSRVMPVTVAQPTINEDTIHDTFIRNMYPSATHGTSSVIWLAHQSPTVGDAEALIRGEFPNLPGNATVLNAYMRAYYYYNDNVTTGTYNIGVYPLADSWTEGGATWNNSKDLEGENSWLYVAYTSAANSATINAPKPINVPMTSLVQGWANDSTTNHGVKLKYENGTNRSVCLRSSESGSTYSPRFYVTYEINRLPDGVYALTSGTNAKKASYNSFNAGGNVRQVTSPANLTDEHLFKFSHLGKVAGEDYYVIRSMMNNGLGLSGTTNGSVIADAVAVANNWDSIPASQRWAVTYVDGFYQIRNGEGGYLSVPSATGNHLITTATATSNSAWSLDKQSIDTNEVVFLEPYYSVHVDGTEKVTAVVQSSSDENGPVQYSVLNGTGEATINSSTGDLSPIKKGTVQVGAALGNSSATTWVTVYIYDTSVNVEFVYDNGYITRHPNAPSRISAEAEALREKYFLEFGVWIEWGTISSFTSLADTCSNGNDPNAHCYCENNEESNGEADTEAVVTNAASADIKEPGVSETNENDVLETNEDGASEAASIDDSEDYESCKNTKIELDYSHLNNRETLHHKNIYNIFAALTPPQNAGTRRIAYIGHVTCMKYIDEWGIERHNSDSVTFGLSVPNGSTACISDRNFAQAHETKTLIHEFGHLFGAKDHYPGNAQGYTTAYLSEQYGVTFSDDCIYGANKENLGSDDPYEICAGCVHLITRGLGG